MFKALSYLFLIFIFTNSYLKANESAVVGITNEHGQRVTGTFISPNWMLTSAHAASNRFNGGFKLDDGTQSDNAHFPSVSSGLDLCLIHFPGGFRSHVSLFDPGVDVENIDTNTQFSVIGRGAVPVRSRETFIDRTANKDSTAWEYLLTTNNGNYRPGTSGSALLIDGKLAGVLKGANATKGAGFVCPLSKAGVELISRINEGNLPALLSQRRIKQQSLLAAEQRAREQRRREEEARIASLARPSPAPITRSQTPSTSPHSHPSLPRARSRPSSSSLRNEVQLVVYRPIKLVARVVNGGGQSPTIPPLTVFRPPRLYPRVIDALDGSITEPPSGGPPPEKPIDGGGYDPVDGEGEPLSAPLPTGEFAASGYRVSPPYLIETFNKEDGLGRVTSTSAYGFTLFFLFEDGSEFPVKNILIGYGPPNRVMRLTSQLETEIPSLASDYVSFLRGESLKRITSFYDPNSLKSGRKDFARLVQLADTDTKRFYPKPN